MNGIGDASEFQRYIALDIHKEYVMVGAYIATRPLWRLRDIC